MSILTELKKLTKKKNATVVSQALPDSLDGSGSGGGVTIFEWVTPVDGVNYINALSQDVAEAVEKGLTIIRGTYDTPNTNFYGIIIEQSFDQRDLMWQFKVLVYSIEELAPGIYTFSGMANQNPTLS